MTKPMLITDTHIGKHVPDALAFPALLKRLILNSRRTDSGCLEWTGWRGRTGYGFTSFRGGQRPTHRLMYMATKGPIPDGMIVLHSCDNPPCMNPHHLSLGTDAENIRQSVERNRHHEASKTHCHRGHELAGDNVYVSRNGSRHCKTCNRIKQRIDLGWPEDLARTAPAGYTGEVPPGLVRVKPPRRRPQESSHCGKGHELIGANRYVTRKGHAECRTCRQAARDRFAAKRVTAPGTSP